MDETSLLDAIRAAPDDDGPRLVYADWLLGRGDLRGEFVQVQCALARLPAGDAERARLEKHARALFRRHVGSRDDWTYAYEDYARGFVDQVELRAATPVAEMRQRLARAPLARRVVFRADRFGWSFGAAATVVRLYTLRDIEDVSFEGVVPREGRQLPPIRERWRGVPEPVDRALVRRQVTDVLVRAKHLERLRALRLHGCGLTDDDLARVAREGKFPRLERLAVANSDVGDAAVDALAASDLAGTLRELDLTDTAVGAPGALALATSSRFRALERVALPQGPFDAVTELALRARFGGEGRGAGPVGAAQRGRAKGPT